MSLTKDDLQLFADIVQTDMDNISLDLQQNSRDLTTSTVDVLEHRWGELQSLVGRINRAKEALDYKVVSNGE